MKSIRFILVFCVSVLALPLLSTSWASATTKSPQCVVSLSPTATETLFAIGAGHQVQAVDNDADFPTKGLPAKRINALNPSVEAVLGICKKTSSYPSTKPDLVIISYDANNIAAKLTNLGVKVVEQDAPTTVNGALDQITQLGKLTGHVKKAKALAASCKKTINADIASVPKHPNKKLTVYYELDPTYYSITSDTFVGTLLKDLGAVNIADADATSADAGYPQLSAEYIASANPKLIFLADTICCKITPAKVKARPGFLNVSAVVHGHVVNLNDDLASRWGPRLALLMNQLTKSVKATLNDSSVWK
jgi:iron complex transport system substrate-binding protein